MHVKRLVGIRTFKIKFAYDTRRGNRRSQEVTMNDVTGDKENVKQEFMAWIRSRNTETPYKAYSNVKILDISFQEVDTILI